MNNPETETELERYVLLMIWYDWRGVWCGTMSAMLFIVMDRCSLPGVDGSRRRVAIASHCLMSTRMTCTET